MATDGEYETRVLSVIVQKKGEAIFEEGRTIVRIDDGAAGEFVRVEQECGAVAFDIEEWPTVRAAIDKMIENCREQT